MTMTLTFGKTVCPYPMPGGKGWIARDVWARFGDVGHFVEPFCGSARMLIMRPGEPQIETINDIDGFVTNFWRAVAESPDAVTRAACWPVNETDLIARRARLRVWIDNAQERLQADPEWSDPKIAGWWCWAMSSSIMSKWWTGRPALGNPGMGVNVPGRDVRQMIVKLSERLRRVRVLCGDWRRVCTPSVLYAPAVAPRKVAVFIDPPYGKDRPAGMYRRDDMTVAEAAREWAIEEGGNRRIRIALCGHLGEHKMPRGWTEMRWARRGGQGNRHKEVVWFSPHCLPAPRSSRSIDRKASAHRCVAA